MTDTTTMRRIAFPDKTYAIGRCRGCPHARHRSNEPLYAWKRGTLRLDDVRCLKCGNTINATSREAHGAFILIDGDVLVEQARAALGRALRYRMSSSEAAHAYEARGNEYGARLHREHAATYEKAIARLTRIVEKGA